MIIKHVYATARLLARSAEAKIAKKESTIGHFSHFSGNRANETHTPS